MELSSNMHCRCPWERGRVFISFSFDGCLFRCISATTLCPRHMTSHSIFFKTYLSLDLLYLFHLATFNQHMFQALPGDETL
jgi:hypothetical protein